MAKLTASLFISAFLILTSYTQAKAQEELTFEPATVSISGLLLGDYVGLSSGIILKGHILHLHETVSISGNSDSDNRRNRKSIRSVDRILLEYSNDDGLDNYSGKQVTVRGELFNAPSDPYHTKILMKVLEISENVE